jgi:hypothetical protein
LLQEDYIFVVTSPFIESQKQARVNATGDTKKGLPGEPGQYFRRARNAKQTVPMITRGSTGDVVVGATLGHVVGTFSVDFLTVVVVLTGVAVAVAATVASDISTRDALTEEVFPPVTLTLSDHSLYPVLSTATVYVPGVMFSRTSGVYPLYTLLRYTLDPVGADLTLSVPFIELRVEITKVRSQK